MLCDNQVDCAMQSTSRNLIVAISQKQQSILTFTVREFMSVEQKSSAAGHNNLASIQYMLAQHALVIRPFDDQNALFAPDPTDPHLPITTPPSPPRISPHLRPAL